MLDEQLEKLGEIIGQQHRDLEQLVQSEIKAVNAEWTAKVQSAHDAIESAAQDVLTAMDESLSKQSSTYSGQIQALRDELTSQLDAYRLIEKNDIEAINAGHETVTQQIYCAINEAVQDVLDTIGESLEKLSTAHALEVNLLTDRLKAQQEFEDAFTARMAQIKDGERGEQGFQGEPGRDGQDMPLIEPVVISSDKEYEKNTVGIYNGGLWISKKKAVDNPDNDPCAWACILDAINTLSVDLQDDHTFRLSARMSSGRLIEDTFQIPFPEHKGIWEAGQYNKGQIVTKGFSFWQAMEDTTGEPPGNGWKQILTAPRGKQGEPGKSIVGPQGVPGRNGSIING